MEIAGQRDGSSSSRKKKSVPKCTRSTPSVFIISYCNGSRARGSRLAALDWPPHTHTIQASFRCANTLNCLGFGLANLPNRVCACFCVHGAHIPLEPN